MTKGDGVLVGVLVVALAVVPAALGYMFGYQAGAREATDAWDTAVADHCRTQVDQAVTDTLGSVGPALEWCANQAGDQFWRVTWMDDFAHAAAAWLYSNHDPQAAYDLLWCASGTATPLQVCLDMLVEGRARSQP